MPSSLRGEEEGLKPCSSIFFMIFSSLPSRNSRFIPPSASRETLKALFSPLGRLERSLSLRRDM